MNHQDRVQWMALWAAQNGAALDLNGECGIGRQCVGITVNGKFPSYEWDDEEFNRIDQNGDVWTPEDAYHKHPCVAVLGRGEEAEEQLYDWLKWFDANNFKIETGATDPSEWQSLGAIGILLGKHTYARMVRKDPAMLAERGKE